MIQYFSGGKGLLDLPSDTHLQIITNDFIPEFSKLKSGLAWKRTVDELPVPLAQLVLPIVLNLIRRSVSELTYTPAWRALHVNDTSVEEPVWKERLDLDADALEILELLLWFLHHESRIRNARSRQQDFDTGFDTAKKRYEQLTKDQKKTAGAPARALSTWTCVCCSEEVSHNRKWCTNHACPSWTLYHRATGEVVLQEVQSESA